MTRKPPKVRDARSRAARAARLDAASLEEAAIDAGMRPYIGDIRKHVARWCAATGEPEAASVSLFGPRAELLRFLPPESLPVTERPLVVVVSCEGLAEFLLATGHEGFIELLLGWCVPATDGALHVLVANEHGLHPRRIYPDPAAGDVRPPPAPPLPRPRTELFLGDFPPAVRAHLESPELGEPLQVALVKASTEPGWIVLTGDRAGLPRVFASSVELPPRLAVAVPASVLDAVLRRASAAVADTVAQRQREREPGEALVFFAIGTHVGSVLVTPAGPDDVGVAWLSKGGTA